MESAKVTGYSLMAMTERDKMLAGQWYNCIDDELAVLRDTARAAIHQHNSLHPAERGAIGAQLGTIIGSIGLGAFIEAPFHCSYGFNIHLSDGVYLNTDCTLLDSATVHIGTRSMLGPKVQIYCAEHHKDQKLRAAGQELARPVVIGEDVWIGGGSIILAGVRIGDGAIVGAGSVVVRDVPSGATVVGNPARILRRGTGPDK
jgi:maltose O-acetyltransferase